jgi:hypothetical protein
MEQKGPDLSALARYLLLWEERRRALDELEAAIRDAVLQLRKTQTVGNVRATFSNPRKSYDYENPGSAAPPAIIAEHTRSVVDWRAVCQDAKIDPVVTPGAGPGSVSIKLMS